MLIYTCAKSKYEDDPFSVALLNLLAKQLFLKFLIEKRNHQEQNS